MDSPPAKFPSRHTRSAGTVADASLIDMLPFLGSSIHWSEHGESGATSSVDPIVERKRRSADEYIIDFAIIQGAGGRQVVD